MAYNILNTPGLPFKHILMLSLNLKLRSNTQKVETQHSGTECRDTFYSPRVVERWNLLSAELVQTTSQESFDRKLDIYLRTKDSISL